MLSQEGAFCWTIVLNISLAEGCRSRTHMIGYINQLPNTQGLMSFIKVDIHQGTCHSDKIITTYTKGKCSKDMLQQHFLWLKGMCRVKM